MLRRKRTKSVEEFIDSHNSNSLTFYNSFGKEEYGMLLSLYEKELSENLETIEFSDSETHKYDMSLKKLSFDLYKTTDLWFIIAYFNDIRSNIEFTNRRYVKVLNDDGLNKLERMIKRLK